jgi:hypothetical protein
MREFWVIRETNEKSFRTLLNIVNNGHEEVFIINERLQLQYYNNQFRKRLIGLIGSVPHSAKEFVHTDSFESFKEKVIGSIKSQNPASITVQLIYKTDELGGTSIYNLTL